MKASLAKIGISTFLLVSANLLLSPLPALAEIDGVEGSTFTLTATDGHISTPDGNSIYTWSYGLGGSSMQFPGPTLIVNQGDTVTVRLNNTLDVPTSLVFPGHRVRASGGVAGTLTNESLPGCFAANCVTYTFVASQPGTYMYHSGTEQDLQIEMGLAGALIVRPAGGDRRLRPCERC